ncbi:MAG: dTMP kinase [Caldimicrobium sp.]
MVFHSPRRALIIYGNPGVGKTTLISSLYSLLSEKLLDYFLTGFITKEVRKNGERIGFDLIYLRDQAFTLPLAKKENIVGFLPKKMPKVGKYLVFVENLERFVEILQRDLEEATEKVVVFVDEIGKMEAFSEKFSNFLDHLWREKVFLVATLGKGDQPLLKDWANKWGAIYCEVTIENRDFLLERLEVEFTRKGRLIVFEGIDGTGKTTIFKLLQEDKAFENCLFSFEPTLGFYGQKLRTLLSQKAIAKRPLSENLKVKEELLELFLLDRKEHVQNFILPNLKKGKNIILDRYYLSTLAYQGDEENFLDLLKKNETFSPLPDWVIYLELSPEEAIKRVFNRGDEKSIFEKEDELRRIAYNYSQILPLFNYLALPAWKSVDSLFVEVRNLLMELLFKDGT